MDAADDAIYRDLVLPAPPQRVWAALTQADALSAWFGTQASVDLRPGGQISFAWDQPGGQRFTNGGLIEVVEPPHRFAFRWQPYVAPEHAARAAGVTTRVEFTLEPQLSRRTLRQPRLRACCRSVAGSAAAAMAKSTFWVT